MLYRELPDHYQVRHSFGLWKKKTKAAEPRGWVTWLPTQSALQVYRIGMRRFCFS